MNYAALAGMLAVSLVAGCQKDETVSAYGGADKTWVLHSLDGATFHAQASLRFPEQGRITGQGPCNSLSASQNAPYPWFSIGPIASTRRACPDLNAENAYFEALKTMTQVEILGDTMILSDDAGRQMVFKSAP
ncbi:MAG: META domain-containing protein [Roseovarius sp.]